MEHTFTRKHVASFCVLRVLVSEAVKEVIGFAKSAIHCKEKCSGLEDSLTEASGQQNISSFHLAAEGSLSSSQLDTSLKALKAKVEEARPLVLECQSLQNPILDGLKRLKKQKEVLSNVVPQEEQHVVPLDKHIFDMEEMLEQVVADLLGSPISSKWVGVHGARGAGKILLAKRVEAKQHELAKRIRLEGNQISIETLRRGLDGKRCLLVLDDVWKFIHLDFFDVVQENGSKIFITTRKRDVLDSKGAIKTEMALGKGGKHLRTLRITIICLYW
ncbi:hypothetical protein SELMODRAFT_411495 [Selaginella moellendorffii]|uniref:NB-ARC domain-containing protein n=1 Tax=Selaginella moellendorffii TaxID=88036 RepID=D8RI45_SELML|nr:hypothetical protein SELMODRAFT_411495 [Selaginella moellendorffii]